LANAKDNLDGVPTAAGRKIKLETEEHSAQAPSKTASFGGNRDHHVDVIRHKVTTSISLSFSSAKRTPRVASVLHLSIPCDAMSPWTIACSSAFLYLKGFTAKRSNRMIDDGVVKTRQTSINEAVDVTKLRALKVQCKK
jgi:hypothetical protein